MGSLFYYYSVGEETVSETEQTETTNTDLVRQTFMVN